MVGEKQRESIHPTFDNSIQIDFKGNRMVLRALGLFQEFFRAEFHTKMRLGRIEHHLMHHSGLENPVEQGS
jgi:hypothetical protein